MSTAKGLPTERSILRMINDSISQDTPFFVLSAYSQRERNQVEILLNTLWEKAQQQETARRVHALSTITCGLPWGEHPAHAFFTGVIEQWDPWSLEIMLLHALRERDHAPLSENTYIVKVVEAMASLHEIGNEDYLSKYSFGQRSEVLKPLLRTYVLDFTSQASDRSKLGLPRAFTTQDRYELLRCVWRCQQGLATDLAVHKHTRLWVFIDEAENMLEYARQEQKMLSKGLSHIIAETSHFLTIWLNISDPEPETIQAVKNAFGAIWQFLDLDLTDPKTVTAIGE